MQKQLSALGYRFYLVDEISGEITQAAEVKPALDEKGGLLKYRLNRIALPDEDHSEVMLPMFVADSGT